MGRTPFAVHREPFNDNSQAWQGWVVSNITHRLKQFEHSVVREARILNMSLEAQMTAGLCVQAGGVDVEIAFENGQLKLFSCIALSAAKRIELDAALLMGQLTLESVEKQGELYAFTFSKQGCPQPFELWAGSIMAHPPTPD